MRFAFIAPVVAALAAATIALAPVGVPAAQAAPAEQTCQATAFRQSDMAGTYVSPEIGMRLEVYPCGGLYLQWDNAYGTHYAVYTSDNRLPGGGVAGGLMTSDHGTVGLDAMTRLGVKPAERGYVQVISADPYGGIGGVYRLRKVS